MVKIILSFLLMYSVQKTWAQQRLFDSTRFGVKAGLNLSHLNFSRGSHLSEGYPESTGEVGLHAGLFMVVPLRRKIFVQPEYLYSQMRGKVGSFGNRYRINYFSLPVLVRWETFRQFAVLAGPQFGLVIDARVSANGETTKIMDKIENRHFGAAFEVEWAILNAMTLGIRYLHGINQVDLHYLEEWYEFKYEIWQISVSYKF